VRRRRIDPREERGATAVFIAISMVALLGMLSLSVDGGALMLKRRGMVNGADAASLAAAQSCAGGDGDADAISHADSIATSNVANAVRQSISFMPACNSPFGEVSVVYRSLQDLFFSPVVGVDSPKPVDGVATALWGVVAGGHPAPIEISGLQARGCGFPDLPPGSECSFWYNNDDVTNGQASWGLMNLNLWDVPAGANCNASGGSNDIGDWIVDGYPDVLSIRPLPTYVCLMPGARAGNWQNDLESQIGETKLFPVNDENRQVTSSGAICTAAQQAAGTCVVDKYFIVAFANLRIQDVLRGNDPAAIGTPGAAGHCRTNPAIRFGPNPPPNGHQNTYSLVTAGCGVANVANLTLTRQGGPPPTVTYQLNVDYSYNPSTFTVTWLRSDTANVRVEWDYSTPGLPGRCGVIPRPDPNARCLIVQYLGITTVAGVPCLPSDGCEDFGVRAIRLSA
jgi:hypothetical protein